MDHAEALLLERGCPKINVQVRGDNAEVIAFYEQRGYRLEPATHAVNLGRRLIEDGRPPLTRRRRSGPGDAAEACAGAGCW